MIHLYRSFSSFLWNFFVTVMKTFCVRMKWMKKQEQINEKQNLPKSKLT